MGPAPSLATYQQQASAIYEPQKQADITTATATEKANVANEEALKPQIQTDYQAAIDNLTAQTNKNVGTINQLYTERLGGNFSGLQGNDLGMMFSTANKQQATIESTRANKLSQISTTETNLANTLNSDIVSIGSKYQGQEQQYADTSYAGAVKDYNTEQYQQQQLQLGYARLNLSAQKEARLAGASANKPLTSTQAAAAIRQQLESNKGKDNHVAPEVLKAAYSDYTSLGFDPKSFWTNFQGYWNSTGNNAYGAKKNQSYKDVFYGA